MKKILFASTALVMSAGVAAADVAVSGDGRMGVTYDNSLNDKWAFTNRIRISFRASGQTDGGLSFGGQIRADNAANGAAGTAGTIFISGAFGRITMGDVHSGDKRINGHLHPIGLTDLDDVHKFSYEADNFRLNGLAQDPLFLATFPGYARVPSRVLYEYSMAGFSFAASHSQTGGNKSAAVGIGYSMDGLSAGIGLGETRYDNFFGPATPTGKARDVTVHAAYNMGDYGVKAIYQDKKLSAGGGVGTIARHRTLGLSGTASFDAVGVTALVKRTKQTGLGGALNATLTTAGLGASYDLGGGASLMGGVARVQEFDLAAPNLKSSRTIADFGVSMRF